MGKYSNVNVSSLQGFAKNAIDEINKYNLTDARNNLKNSQTIKSSVTKIVSDSLYDIIYSANKNGSLKTLKNKLENLLTASEYIKKYQQAEADLVSLKQKLYKKETSYEYSTDSNGNTTATPVIEWVIDKFVQAQIKNVENNIASYENRIDFYLK